jgi:carboxyl-terminal processing protease
MRSGAFLVDFLKTPDDRFSALFPPQAAKEFEQEVLGVRVDLGIEGTLCEQGFCVDFVESRADAFEKGLRPADIIVKINNLGLKKMTLEKIQKLLTPEMNTMVKLEYVRPESQGTMTMNVQSKEYFKETVFPITIPYEGIFGLEIRRFNRMTAEDLSRYLFIIKQQKNIGLILDLRGNPGGPPLAAREIVSFFLEPEKNFAYFQRKGDERNYLDVPRIPDEYRYHEPIIILVNQESGSASELFSGVMQKEGRALLMGTNTAGQVFLLVTARGHFPSGEAFDFNGLTPQYRMDNNGIDLVYFAAGYLLGAVPKK